ncbi:two-partner secretion domain-containing protein (plasmid) [Ralstonia sp. 25C]|uniref:two-partner secretion domain-containing protein n=1 Tax=Ralstonia sp. 25C TaxID=3447363 RepID=UPI003F750330
MHRHATKNRAYRLIWSRTAQCWVAVAEHVRGRRAGGAMLVASLIASAPALAGPSGGVVTSGAGSIGQSGATTTITQTTPRLAIDWARFSIQPGESVNFIQPGAGAIALNRVTGSESSSILGALNANGTVFLLNPNGVLFGAGAHVNVGGLVASTLNLSNADFEAGRYAFSGSSSAGVVNQGTISVPSGGKVALIANRAENTGSIQAPGGDVLLAGVGAMTLTLADGSPLGYTISQGAARTLVNNGGMIVADGGRVVLTARGLDALSESVVNTTGVVQARTVSNRQGTIELAGDPVVGVTQVSGRLDASATEAGGVGGTVKVTGNKVGLFDGAQINVRGKAGGGTALIGGNARGEGAEPNATATYVAADATIDASATTRGDGGKIIVWGTDVANVHGTLAANGGAQGGQGGHIETSGHALDTDGIAVSVTGGPGGAGGSWLLDPYNVTISTGPQTGGSFSSGVWTPSASGSLVNISSIQSLLNSGSNVTITTTGAGAQEGNIAINSSIAKTAGGNASLTLIADGRITTNASSGAHRGITSTSGALNVSMTANATTSAATTSGIALRYLDISANGGNISATASGAQSATAPALSLQNNTWATTGTGNISLSGVLPSNANSQGVFLSANTLSTVGGAITVSGTSGGVATVTGNNSNGAPLFSTNNIGVDLAGSNTLRSTGGGAITLNGTATGATATWAGSGVTLSALDTLSTSGALTIAGTASNPASTTYRNQLSAVDVAGSGANAASLTGGTINITGTNSVVGGASSTSNTNAAVKLEGKVNLTATSGAITIAGSNAGGDGVWGSGTGAVTMSAPTASAININAQSLDSVSGYSGFYIGSGATLTFATAAPVTISASSQATARHALWIKGGLTTPGNLSISTTAGSIQDDATFGGVFHVGGGTTIASTGNENSISLTNSGNAFGGPVALSATNATLVNGTALVLGTSNLSGNLSATASGISQTGAVNVSGTSTFNAGTSAITLANTGNTFGGAVSLTGSNATLVDSGALTLGTSALTGNLNATAAGISQSGALAVAGTTTLDSGSSAIALTNTGNALTTLAVTQASGVDVVNGRALTVTNVASAGGTKFTTLSGDLAAQGNWSITGGDLTLSAGAATGRGVAAGGDVRSSATLAMDAGRHVTVYTGALSSTVLGGTLASRAAAGSGNFRYNRQDGDAAGATGVGDGLTTVMYRERPTVTVTPTDASNTKVYDGGSAADPSLAYSATGLVNGDTAAQSLSGSLARATGQDAGSYTVNLGTLADRLGYQVQLAAGHAFTITPASLLITANDATRVTGQANPAFSVAYTGLVNGQTPQTAGLQGTLTFATDATTASPAGRYAVLPGGLIANNYSVRYAAGTLTVTLAPPVLVSVPVVVAPTPPTSDAAPPPAPIIDTQVKARLAGLSSAPAPAELLEHGWRTSTAIFDRVPLAGVDTPVSREEAAE